jgi:hypothetical protein
LPTSLPECWQVDSYVTIAYCTRKLFATLMEPSVSHEYQQEVLSPHNNPKTRILN